MQQISQGVKSEDLQNEVKNLTTRLTTANKNRAHQAQLLKYHLRQSPYPVILCGDFNDTPLSFTYPERSWNRKYLHRRISLFPHRLHPAHSGY